MSQISKTSNGQNEEALGKTAGSRLTGGSDVDGQMQQIIDPAQAEEFMRNVHPDAEADGALS